MKQIIIGISSSIEKETESQYLNTEKIFLNNEYIKAIIKVGAIPLILPVIENLDTIKEYAKIIDGLIISGGYDVNPKLYNQKEHNLLGEVSIKRDFFELNLIKEVHKLNKPIFGICRGMQLINVYFGGSLYQDISLAPFNTLNHSQNNSLKLKKHTVKLYSFLKDLLNNKTYEINSFHHQSIDRLAEGFEILADSDDGIIEAIFSENDNSWIFATQWHPEMLIDSDNISIKIFENFIKICKKRRDGI